MSEFKLHIEKGGYVSKSTLLAYLNNELNAADKQHVEHLIAEDPFLLDAIEGLRGADSKVVETTLNAIYKDVDVITGTKKPFTITATLKKYAAAAMLIVFFGLTFLIMNVLNKSQTNDAIAIENEVVEAQQSEANGNTDGMGAGDMNSDTTIEPEVAKTIRSKSNSDEEIPITSIPDIAYDNGGESVSDGVSETKYLQEDMVIADEATDVYKEKEVLFDKKPEVDSKTGSAEVLTSGPVVVGEVSYNEGVSLSTVSEKKVSDKAKPASTDDADFGYIAADSIAKEITKPEYPGGLDALNKYLAKSIDYKNTGEVNGTIYVQFIIDENGKINSPVITIGINEKVNAEVIRSINRMPKWKPAHINNKNINVQISMPIYFGSQN